MTKKIIAVDLTFPEQAEFYGPRPNDKHSTYPKRQKLRGKLRLITSQPTTLSSVEIRFKGQTNLHWRDPLTHSLLASRIQGTRLIRKSKHALLQEATIPSGVTDLGFEVTIPGYVCPTYTTDFVSIKYTVAARIVPLGKFTKDIEIERPITVRKTLMPKDIAQGMITGYQVPQRPMHGQRPGYLAWEFKVPKWACLGASVAFVGALKPLQNNITIDRINVDVVQEELYHDDAGDQRRRHVTFCRNRPSTYLHPPVGSNIAFDFPLHNHGLLSSTSSSSSSSSSGHSSSKSGAEKTTFQEKNSTFVKLGHLNYSLESPFLHVRHYLRLMIYTRHKNAPTSPICIGLPLYITQQIDHDPDALDTLPTYQTVTRDGERLPDYATTLQIDQQDDDNDNDDNDPESIPAQETRRKQLSMNNITIPERRLDDFWVVM